MPQPTEGGYNLVRQVKHVVLTANFETTLMITLGRYDDPTRCKNRFGYEDRAIIRTNLVDHVLQVANAGIEKLGIRLTRGLIQGMWCLDVMHQSGLEIEVILVALLAGHATTEISTAVITSFL